MERKNRKGKRERGPRLRAWFGQAVKSRNGEKSMEKNVESERG